jgi:hypothetical protein
MTLSLETLGWHQRQLLDRFKNLAGIFRSSQTLPAICRLPLVAAIFVCSPLFSDFPDAMSLKMSLATNAFEVLLVGDLRVKFPSVSKHCGVRGTYLVTLAALQYRTAAPRAPATVVPR